MVTFSSGSLGEYSDTASSESISDPKQKKIKLWTHKYVHLSQYYIFKTTILAWLYKKYPVCWNKNIEFEEKNPNYFAS